MVRKLQIRTRAGLIVAILTVQAILLGMGWFFLVGQTRVGLALELEERVLRDGLELARDLADQIEAEADGSFEPGSEGWERVQRVIERQTFPAHGLALVIDDRGGIVCHPELIETPTLQHQRYGAGAMRIAGTESEIPIVSASARAPAVGTVRRADGVHYIAACPIADGSARLVFDQPEWGLLPLRRGAEQKAMVAAGAVGVGVLGLTAAASLLVVRRFESLLIEVNQGLEEEIGRRVGELLSTRHALILGLAKLADFRDTDTGAHLERICEYCVLLAEAMRGDRAEITDAWISDLQLAASLHDIGKVGIPDSVLLKPGRLDEREREIIERHPVFGAQTLLAIRERLGRDPLIDMGIDVAHQHHERWDGRGYPSGLSGETIALSARIVAIADFYDAITSERVYKAAMSHEHARELIVSERGRHFDPGVVDAFERVHERFRELRAQREVDGSRIPARRAA